MSSRPFLAAAALLALAPLADAQIRIGPSARPPSSGPAERNLDPPLSTAHDGFAIGNGAVGALVWGEGNVMRITLNRGDLWDERPEAQPKEWSYAKALELARAGDRAAFDALFDRPIEAGASPGALPLGRIELTYPEAQKVRRFRFDPARLEVSAGYGTCRTRIHVSAMLPIVLVRADNDFPTLKFVPSATSLPAAEAGSEGNLRWTVQKLPDGSSHAIVCAEYRDAKGVTFVITTSRAAAGADPVALARPSLELSPTVTYDQIVQTFHVAWWYEHWKQSWIELSDTRIQAQYDVGRCLLGAGSRGERAGAGGAPLVAQGLWRDDASPSAGRRVAYDHEGTTWAIHAPCPALGYSEPLEALLKHLEAAKPRFVEHAKGFFGVEGIAVPGAASLAGQTVGGKAGAPVFPASTAELAQLFVAQWKHTGDDAFLRERAYPWCATAGQALMSLLVLDGETLRPAISAAALPGAGAPRPATSGTSNRDLALLTGLFGALEEMAPAAGKPDDAGRWGLLLSKLEKLDVDASSKALTVAPGSPYSGGADLSHAYAIHPLGLLSVEGPEAERAVVLATIAQIESQGAARWTPATFASFAALCARAGLADKALAQLEAALAFAGENGLQFESLAATRSDGETVARGPFSVAASTAFTHAVNEMLLQGWGGTLRVFPAVPLEWTKAQFEGLRAEGAWKVSARRDETGTQWVSVTALRAGQLRLRDPFPAAEARWSRDDVHHEGSDYVVDLAAGEVLEGWRRAP